MKNRIAVVFLAASIAFGQTATKPAALSVRDTPAAQSLNDYAKSQVKDDAEIQAKLTTARNALSEQIGPINKEIEETSKEINQKLAEDKRYKPLLDKIAALRKQQTELQNTASRVFAQAEQTTQSRYNAEVQQVQALIEVVRKENNLSASANYNVATQQWTQAADAQK